jgi:hypothetical protein
MSRLLFRRSGADFTRSEESVIFAVGLFIDNRDMGTAVGRPVTLTNTA